MTPTASILSESAIAAPVVKEWRSEPNTTTLEEVVVVHPSEGQVSIDLIHECADESLPNWIAVAEAKRRMGRELFAQCERWKGLANERWAIIETPRQRTDAFDAWARRFCLAGIGLYLSDGRDFHVEHIAAHDREARTGLLTRAIRDTPDCGPSAGSAAAQRMTDARREWKDIIEFLHELDSTQANFAEIKRATRTRKTAAALRKAIDEGGLPLQYEGYPTSYFWYVQRKGEER